MDRHEGTASRTGGRGRGAGRTAAALAGILACAPLAFAESIEPAPAVSAPPSAESLQKVGEARLRVLFWSIYDSRLYTATGSYRPGERPLRLEVEYLRDIASPALVKRTREEWQAMGRNHPRQEQWLARLDNLWPDIAAGDVLAIHIDENDESTFRHNGRTLGTIEDPAFGREFTAIWLSEDSTRPEVRQALLGIAEAD